MPLRKATPLKQPKHFLFGIGYTLLGGIFSFLFLNDYRLPPAILSPLLMTLFIGGCLLMQCGSLSLLPRVIVLLYSVPFASTLGFVFDSSFSWWETPLADPYCRDHELNSVMLLIGATGLCGLLGGVEFACVFPLAKAKRPPAILRLGMPAFLFMLASAGLFSYLSTPKETILTTTYVMGDGTDWSSKVGLNAGALISYILLALLYVDAEGEPNLRHRRIKLGGIIAVSLWIIIVLQLLRGNRESTGLIAGLVSLYLSEPTRAKKLSDQLRSRWRRIALILVPLTAIVVAFLAIGVLRSALSDKSVSKGDIKESFRGLVLENTWTAVALTNIGHAAEVVQGHRDYYWGETYVEYILSIPPGMVAESLGYKRPINNDEGPAWWYIPLSAGGIHAVVVPVKNFGIAGGLLVMGIVGFWIARLQLRANAGFWWRYAFAALATCSPSWIWYGDMNLLRGMTIALSLGLVYSLFAQRHRPMQGRQLCTS